jgi:hypothetical protein
MKMASNANQTSPKLRDAEPEPRLGGLSPGLVFTVAVAFDVTFMKKSDAVKVMFSDE